MQIGGLKLIPKPLNYSRASGQWTKIAAGLDIWTIEPIWEHRGEVGTVALNTITCPNCHNESEERVKVLKWDSRWTNIKCLSCHSVCHAHTWMCRCGNPWRKCERHLLHAKWDICNKRDTTNVKRKGPIDGVDKPFPTIRKLEHGLSIKMLPTSICLPAGTKLARKFPHLVRDDDGAS